MNPHKLISEAVTAFRISNFSLAHRLCSTVLSNDSKNIVALHLLGVVEAQLKNTENALRLFDRALEESPQNADILTDKGRVLNGLGRHPDALFCYKQALAINPKQLLAVLNCGCTLLLLDRSREALLKFDELLAIAPDYPLALHNRSIALTDLRRYEEAIVSSDRALKINPEYAEALQSRGVALEYMRRFDLSAIDLKHALRLNPEIDYLRGNVCWALLNCCEWGSFLKDKAKIENDLHAGKRVATPFSLLAMSDSLRDQQLCAEMYAADKYPVVHPRLSNGQVYDHDKIRVAYLSSDFHDHPVPYLLAGMFECHDRSRFETTALSYGPDDNSEIRRRLKSSFAHFIDVQDQNNDQVADLIKAREIDILVDLSGYTAHARPGILARGAAPIQINYLGFSGTMGAKFVDYIIADPVLIQNAEREFFTEKVVHLPGSYMGNDSKRKISERVFRRDECDLPEAGFIFCCFSNSYKITSEMFDLWMRLLNRIGDSVLWLSNMNETAKNNLRREAKARNVDSARLVFAQRIPSNADHLARLRLADLFLDTLPCNAHSTASDALWAGLPVLTSAGKAFAGRVAASLLNAIDIPELIAKSVEDYERIAFEIATSSERLSSLKQKLASNRRARPLFDTALFTNNIEAAYIAMYERHRAGMAPDHIVISS